MLVSTKSGILLRAVGGFEGPKVDVKVKLTSSAMYVVAAKKARVKNEKGGGEESGVNCRAYLFRERKLRTISELGVPSSTTCVATMALPSSVQKRAATTPACMAERTAMAVVPWSINEPVVTI